MSGLWLSHRLSRSLKAGGPPAVITAALGVGATGIVGRGIEAKTDPLASGAARAVGVSPRVGPALLVVAAVLILALALVVPGLFDDRR